MLVQERIIIFTGHFGSGKTELAVNYASRSAAEGRKTTLVDLDIVNPFFRSTEIRQQLEDRGVKVISPNFAATTVDIPSLPAEIYSVFSDYESRVAFDVGGDETGAGALGQYFPYFKREPYRMFYVINAKRPLSADKEDILEMLAAVQVASRLKVTDIVNNTNLSYETRVSDLVEGQAVVEEAAVAAGLPVTFVSGMRHLKDALPPELQRKFIPVDLYMKPPWQRDSYPAVEQNEPNGEYGQ
jgi:hypothetical protein